MFYKNIWKTLMTSLLTTVLILGTFAGCSSQTSQNPESSEPLSTSLVESDAQSDQGNTREITDMAGRKVTVPTKIDHIFPTGPVSSIFIYTLNPDKLLGWNYDLNAHERAFTLAEYHDLPSFGMGDAINYEAVLSAKPDIAIDVSAVNEASIANADKLSESLGIPVLIVSNDLEDTAAAYRFLGDLLSVQEHAAELAQYTEQAFSDIVTAQIPEDEYVSIYFGNGIDSLETAPRGSSHAQLFNIVGTINVADVETEKGSRVQVSAEQLLAWDPEYIIVNGEPKKDLTGNGAAKALLENPDFATLQAVKNDNIFAAPKAPFSWVDRPAGPNRIIGIRWLASVLYPEYYDYDVDEEVRTFFKLFYHMELTDEQLQELYNS